MLVSLCWLSQWLQNVYNSPLFISTAISRGGAALNVFRRCTNSKHELNGLNDEQPTDLDLDIQYLKANTSSVCGSSLTDGTVCPEVHMSVFQVWLWEIALGKNVCQTCRM